jgi:hypothetical protein
MERLRRIVDQVERLQDAISDRKSEIEDTLKPIAVALGYKDIHRYSYDCRVWSQTPNALTLLYENIGDCGRETLWVNFPNEVLDADDPIAAALAHNAANVAKEAEVNLSVKLQHLAYLQSQVDKLAAEIAQ